MYADDARRIQDMLREARKALSFIQGRERAALDEDEMLAYAVIRALEIVGEAAAQVSLEYRQRHPDVRWQDIIGMRNRLIHAYSRVNRNIVWETVSRDLPDLINALETSTGPDAAG